MKILKYIFFILLIYIAISLSIGRILIIYAEKNADYIEEIINKNDNINVQITSIKGNWKGFYPSINLNIKNNNINSKFKFPENVKIQLNIYKTIFVFKPVLKSVSIEKIYYKTDLKNLISKINENNKYYIVENINIKKSNFVLKDKENTYDFKNTKIKIEKNNIIFAANIDEDKKVLAYIKNIEIQKNKIVNLDYKIKTEGNFNYIFKKIFKKYNININNSEISMTLIGNYNHGNLNNNKISILTNKKSTLIVNNYKVDNFNIKAILNGNIKNKFDIEILESDFIVNKNKYKFSDIAATYKIKTKRLLFFSDNIIIDSKKISNDLNFQFIDNLSFIAKISKFKLNIDLDNYKDNFYFSGFFSNADLSFKQSSLKNFSGYVEFNNNSAFLEFDSKNIYFANSKIFREQLNFDNVTGKVSVRNYSNPVFNLNNISIINEQINIVANGFVDIKNNSINITTHIPKVDMRYITNYLPLNFMSKKTGQYFSKSFKNGISKNAFIKINGNISNYPFYENFEGNSYAIFPISQLYVDYRDGWVPFKNVSGTAYFNKKNAYFKSDQLMILDTSMNNANMYISNVTDARLFIKGELHGPFVDLLKFSNKASLTNIDVKQINNISGNSKTNFKMKLNFDGKENYYESSIKLNNLSYKLDDNNYLKDIKGIIKFKENKFYTEKTKITGKYNNYNIKFSLLTDKKNNFILNGEQKINISNFIDNKFIKNKIKGKSNWLYEIKIPGFNNSKDNINIKTISNLDGTSILYPEPLLKTKDSKIKTIVKAQFLNKKFSNIEVMYNNIYFESKSLNNFVGYINFSGYKLKLPKKGFNIFGKIDNFDLGKWKEFSGDNDINYFKYINRIDIIFSKFINKDIIFDNLIIKGDNKVNSFEFTEISSNSKYANINSFGLIEFDNITSFKINLTSKNLEELLNYWKFKHGLRESSINSNFDISWKGSLFDFDLSNIYGKFSTNMKEGRLKKVGNRATRIFGLFNIDLLAKRLSLDFDDVTKNGFYFNTFDGDFRIENGSIFTTNLIIRGPSAEMLTVGTTDFINETYDMQVVASPEFGETLPAIALLGGPITAAATFAAEKLAKAFGKDINDLIKIKYKVTGSWDNPVIDIINKDSGVLDNIEDLFK